jgi:hypothetical protein
MAARRSMAAPNARAARISGAVFASAGAIAVLAGVLSVLVGVPAQAHDLTPLAGPGEVLSRFGEMAPLLSAGIAAIVAIGVAGLLVGRRLEPQAAVTELLVLALVMEVCIGAATSRVGHAADGGVLMATVVCLMGGVGVVAGALISALGRE